MTPKGIMNERTVEYAFVFRMLAKSGAKNALDVGTGMTALPALIKACQIPVRSIEFSRKAIDRNPYLKPIHDDILKPRIKPGFDFITCISVLEHIVDYDRAVRNMIGLLNKGGILVMTFPYNENFFVHNAYALKDSGYGSKRRLCRQYNADNVEKFCNMGTEVIDVERWQIFTGKFWTQGERLKHPKLSVMEEPHHLLCIALKKI
jgi:SAM-dependent methyltransferase